MKKYQVLLLVLLLSFLSSSVQGADKVVVVPLGKKMKIITREFHYPLGPASFSPTLFQSGQPVVNMTGGNYIRYTAITTSPVGMKASVNLPDGAAVSALTCFVYDNDAEENFHSNSPVSFYRRMISSADTPENMAPMFNLETAGSMATVQSIGTASISYPTIDNSNYFYWVYFLLRFTAYSPDLRFYGCQITYSLDVLTP